MLKCNNFVRFNEVTRLLNKVAGYFDDRPVKLVQPARYPLSYKLDQFNKVNARDKYIKARQNNYYSRPRVPVVNKRFSYNGSGITLPGGGVLYAAGSPAKSAPRTIKPVQSSALQLLNSKR